MSVLKKFVVFAEGSRRRKVRSSIIRDEDSREVSRLARNLRRQVKGESALLICAEPIPPHQRSPFVYAVSLGGQRRLGTGRILNASGCTAKKRVDAALSMIDQVAEDHEIVILVAPRQHGVDILSKFARMQRMELEKAATKVLRSPVFARIVDVDTGKSTDLRR